MAAITMSRVNIFDTVLGTIRLCPKMSYMFYKHSFPASVFSVLKDYVCLGVVGARTKRRLLDGPGGIPAAEVADDREPGSMPRSYLPRSDGRQPVVLNLMTNQKTRNAKFVCEVIQCFFAHYPRATQATA